MKCSKRKLIFFFIFVFFCLTINVYAEEKKAVLKDAVYIRKGPGTNYGYYILGKSGTSYSLKKETVVPDEPKNGACNAGWYEIDYNGNSAYACASFVQIKNVSDNSDELDRPWTTPKKAIIGGARFITSSYINKGQFTSYLKKFNVNPNSSYSIYNHQYMANLAAPSSEAYTSYTTYSANKLLELPLEFTIPIFEKMPDYTQLPGKEIDKACEATVTDAAFEELLNEQGFPESYKCKLRLLHKEHPNWIFKSLKTGLDFDKSVYAEQRVSSIQGDAYKQKTTTEECRKFGGTQNGSYCQTEAKWFVANNATVGYYLDPRNFLNEKNILMFENLGYSDNYTEVVVQNVLKGTFMSGNSELDKQSYASIFVEAGKQENISAVYLASLARIEAGVKLSNTTNGAQFTYQGVTYVGLYNFFNIGAYGSAENPALAGLVYASGGSKDVIVNGGSSTSPSVDNDEKAILTKIGANVSSGCLQNLTVGTTIGTIKNKLSDYTVTINAKDNDIIKTGQEITISDSKKTYKYIIVVKGDLDGDGKLGATDYVKIKNYIMEKKGSELNTAQSLAADVDGDGNIKATDYVRIKNSIMGG